MFRFSVHLILCFFILFIGVSPSLSDIIYTKSKVAISSPAGTQIIKEQKNTTSHYPDSNIIVEEETKDHLNNSIKIFSQCIKIPLIFTSFKKSPSLVISTGYFFYLPLYLLHGIFII